LVLTLSVESSVVTISGRMILNLIRSHWWSAGIDVVEIVI
jgi:hypothetical protein